VEGPKEVVNVVGLHCCILLHHLQGSDGQYTQPEQLGVPSEVDGHVHAVQVPRHVVAGGQFRGSRLLLLLLSAVVLQMGTGNNV
jgi:hypothetical protein